VCVCVCVCWCVCVCVCVCRGAMVQIANIIVVQDNVISLYRMSKLHIFSWSKKNLLHRRELRDFYGNAYRQYGGLNASLRICFSGNSLFYSFNFHTDLLQPSRNKELLSPIPYFPYLRLLFYCFTNTQIFNRNFQC
jgi:hypothetical protein